MTDYRQWIPHLLQWETGSPNGWSVKSVPGDNGGLTVSGLTWNTYKSLCYQLLGIKPTIENFKALSRKNWEVFVKWFWDKFTLNNSIKSQAIAEMVVDFAWGSKFAIRQIQRMLNSTFNKNLQADNVIGPQTIAALNSLPEAKLLPALKDARINYYKSLDDWAQFGKGWTNRVNSLMTKLMAYIKANPIKTIGFFLPFTHFYGQ